jgi:hypothetical protein
VPTERSAVGSPTTVIYAENLSERAILDAVRAGHVFIDTQGTLNRAVEFTAKLNDATATMGDTVNAPAGSRIHFSLTMSHLAEAHAEVIRDGQLTSLLDKSPAKTDQETREFDETSDGNRHWLRINIRSAEGTLLLLGNPIYFNFPVPQAHP